MKKILFTSVLLLGLVGCGQEIPPPPPEPQQPSGKWGEKFEPAVNQCAQINASGSYSGGYKVETWATYCRCVFQIAASKWTFEEFAADPSKDAQLWKEGVHTSCATSAGIK